MRTAAITFGLSLIICFTATAPAMAAGVDLPIGVTLVKCGETRTDIPKMCKKDSRCCALLRGAPMTMAYNDAGNAGDIDGVMNWRTSDTGGYTGSGGQDIIE